MGVPAFFRWLTMRHPMMVISATQSQQANNPPIDRFYIDMNGLIHPACNPQQSSLPFPSSFQQQCANIQHYVDRLINIVKPRQLLFLAVDGVAPRAKMIQQRSRRFRSSLQGNKKKQCVEQLLKQYEKYGMKLPQMSDLTQKKSFDSNVITPGTQFLHNVCLFISSYILKRMDDHPLWKNLTVIFSDANSPGQGQHKIMQFIRQQRGSINYNSSLSHCLYGADADLLMLGLATHQKYFYVIRETIVTEKQKVCSYCGRNGHFFFQCKGNQKCNNIMPDMAVDFQFVQLSLFRDYITLYFKDVQLSFKKDTERIIDDFNLICTFVGNDFLPKLPNLSIRQGGIDILLFLYKEMLPTVDDYITKQGQINFYVLQKLIRLLAQTQQSLTIQQSKRNDNNRKRSIIQQSIQKISLKQFINKKPSKDQILDRFKDDIKQLNSSIVKVQQIQPQLRNIKQSYYNQKFKLQPKDFLQFRSLIKQAYAEALYWVCKYYNQGCISWSFFYPFHYAPFPSDLLQIFKIKINLQLNKPFKPIQQLVAVLPPKTSFAIPPILRYLLSQQSPIADMSPHTFVTDTKDKKFNWLGEVLLPPIQEDRLLECMGDYQQKLTNQQKIRNQLRKDYIFIKKNLPEQLVILDQMTIIRGNAKKLRTIGQICIGEYQLGNKIHHKCEVQTNQMIDQQELRIDQIYLQKVDRRGFGGQRNVNLVRRALGIKYNFGDQSKSDWFQFHADSMRNRGERIRSRQHRDGGKRDRDGGHRDNRKYYDKNK